MRPKKHLGQNFLTAPKVVEDIVVGAGIAAGNTVLEIGPGKGMLTRALLAHGAHVVAIEKDEELIPLLAETFTESINNKKLSLIHGDILTTNIQAVIQKPYCVVANIPYYITGSIIRLFLETVYKPEHMTLLVQKEVAERIVARDGKESILSLSVKLCGEPSIIRTVGRGAFFPKPSVDSAVLSIRNIHDAQVHGGEKKFFDLIHAGFAHKRKKLFSNLLSLIDEKKLTEAFDTVSLSRDIRAEAVSFLQWVRLAELV